MLSKPGHRFDAGIALEVVETPQYVSRGGDKLAAALRTFHLSVKGLVCLDVGASTGGFTDCLLQHGAAQVLAVDVGRGQLHWRLRNDPHVTVMEGLNARNLKPDDLPAVPGFAAVDVSFISLTKVLPAVTNVMVAGAPLVTLIKPQFEAERGLVGKGGVVRDPEVHAAVIEKVKRFGTTELPVEWIGCCESPLKGPAGNIEFLACWSLL